MINVKENPHDQPDVSKVRPVYVPVNMTRSYTMRVVFINGQGKYQRVPGYWDDIQKLWRYASSGEKITYEVVKTEPLKETTKHYED